MKEAMKKWLSRHQMSFDTETANSICNRFGLEGEKADECIGLCYQLERGNIDQVEFTGGLCVLTGKEPDEVMGVLRGVKVKPSIEAEIADLEKVVTEGGRDVSLIKEWAKREGVSQAQYLQKLREIVKDLSIPKTFVTSLGFEVEIPVAMAAEVLVNENIISSGFHGALNQRWTIVFRGKVSDRVVKAAEAAGLDVTYRENFTDVSLPDVGITEIEKATQVFNKFAELYAKAQDEIKVQIRPFFGRTDVSGGGIFTLYKGDKEIGRATVSFHHKDIMYPFSGLMPAKSALMDMMEINEDERGKGYGSKFINEIEKIAKENGMKVIYLTSVMGESEEFWRKKGYQFSGHKRIWIKEL